MRRGEYLFAIDKHRRIINRVDWPRNMDEQRACGEVYGWSALWETKHSDGSYSDPIYEKVRFLVWVTVQAWHKDTRDDDASDGRFGDFLERHLKVTIYDEPSEGFEKLQEESSIYENLRLDNQTFIRGTLDKNHDIVTLNGHLGELCRLFQDDVYFNGMKNILDNSKFRGASGEFGSVKVLVAEMCGYDRVMLEDAMSYITFQLRPEAKMMYVLGMDGTLPQLRYLVKTVVKFWSKPELREAFKPDKNVSVM